MKIDPYLVFLIYQFQSSGLNREGKEALQLNNLKISTWRVVFHSRSMRRNLRVVKNSRHIYKLCVWVLLPLRQGETHFPWHCCSHLLTGSNCFLGRILKATAMSFCKIAYLFANCCAICFLKMITGRAWERSLIIKKFKEQNKQIDIVSNNIGQTKPKDGSRRRWNARRKAWKWWELPTGEVFSEIE